MSETAVAIPETVKTAIEERLAWARSVTIRNGEERTRAVETIKECKGLIAEIKAKLDKSCTLADQAHKEACRLRDSFLAAPKEVDGLLRAAVARYDAEQERIRMEEQRRLQAEADERARKERERLEREASKLKTPELREARLEAAAAVVAPVVTMPTAPRVDGESKRVTWKARLVDRCAFIRAAAAAGRFEFLVVDEPALNAFARRTMGEVALTGVEFYKETGLRVSIK